MITCTFENGNKALARHAVADVLVLSKGKILLVKRTKGLLESGKWGLIGGFVKRDETTKQTVARKVNEETGWREEDITLFRINDNPKGLHEDWQSVAFVYFCNAVKQEGKSDWESDDQQWFLLNSLPPKEEIAFDHAENIAKYLEYLKNQYNLPIL